MVIKDKFRFACLCFLFLLFTFLISQKIHFSVADLGRHIKNGELILQGDALKKVLSTNYYSYTFPDYPFLNHHWGSGVIFYLINQIFGFSGLSVFFVFLSVLTFFFFFKVAEKNSNFNLAFLISVFLLPLFAYRVEIRPEVFSYFFCGLFWWILDMNAKGEKRKLIYFLPVLMLFWVNLHVYFVLGLFLIGTFLAEETIKGLFKGKIGENKGMIVSLLIVFMVSVAACLANPAGIKGFLYPLHIFDEYGYSVFENQSLFYIEKIIGFFQPGIYYKIALGIFVLSFAFALVRKSKLSVSYLLFAVFFGYLSIKAVRNFALFGFFALPIICANLSSIKKQLGKRATAFNFATINLFVLFIFLLFVFDSQYWINRDFGWGLRRNSFSASDFFLKNKLKGPIFNNYDIGGSLIYSLYPKEKVFVDNRPEAYPASFFKEVYIPMLDQKSVWDIQTQKYNFNSIFFYRLDLTNWGQAFLIRIVQDPLWAPVYVDEYNIIFLKRNEGNSGIIKKFELPKEMFSVKN